MLCWSICSSASFHIHPSTQTLVVWFCFCQVDGVALSRFDQFWWEEAPQSTPLIGSGSSEVRDSAGHPGGLMLNQLRVGGEKEARELKIGPLIRYQQAAL